MVERAETAVLDRDMDGPVVMRAAALHQLAELGMASGDDLVGELHELLAADAPRQIAAMQRGLVDGALPAVQHAAHSLKSSCATLGGERAARLCREIESCSRCGGDLATLGLLLTALEVEVGLFLRELAEFVKSRGPGGAWLPRPSVQE